MEIGPDQLLHAVVRSATLPHLLLPEVDRSFANGLAQKALKLDKHKQEMKNEI